MHSYVLVICHLVQCLAYFLEHEFFIQGVPKVIVQRFGLIAWPVII